MDWIISVTTLLANSGLGWARGAWWMWLLHACNGAFWIAYSIMTQEYGLILVAAGTIVVDVGSLIRERAFKPRD